MIPMSMTPFALQLKALCVVDNTLKTTQALSMIALKISTTKQDT